LNDLFIRLLGLRCLATYGFLKGAAPISHTEPRLA
jgi:hypothetical protein